MVGGTSNPILILTLATSISLTLHVSHAMAYPLRWALPAQNKWREVDPKLFHPSPLRRAEEHSVLPELEVIPQDEVIFRQLRSVSGFFNKKKNYRNNMFGFQRRPVNPFNPTSTFKSRYPLSFDQENELARRSVEAKKTMDEQLDEEKEEGDRRLKKEIVKGILKQLAINPVVGTDLLRDQVLGHRLQARSAGHPQHPPSPAPPRIGAAAAAATAAAAEAAMEQLVRGENRKLVKGTNGLHQLIRIG